MREVVSLGFETGLLYEGMILQPAGTKATRVEETIAMDFHKVTNSNNSTTALFPY